jgi:tetratricopeptide (TPR) repeat protein
MTGVLMAKILNFNNTARLPAAGKVLVVVFFLCMTGCAGVSPPVGEAQQVVAAPVKSEDVDSSVRAEFDAAMKLLDAGNFEKGIEQLNLLTQRAKNNTAPYINLAIAYQKVGDLAAAEENLKKALAINPEHPVANNEYGLVYRRTGRFAQAKTSYEKTLERSPSFLPARKNLAILCDLYMKDLECALKNYQVYSQAFPNDKAVGIWIADLQKRLGR